MSANTSAGTRQKTSAAETRWTKDGLHDFLKVCDDNYIEVIPLFQTLGHLEWFFQNGQNLEMAEDPATPYAYNVSHPGVYPAMDAILDEVIEVFKPKYVHIGHDEIDMIGRFPYQPENVKRGLVDVVYSDIMHYYDYLKKRGIGVMMWHDMIVTKTECPYNGPACARPTSPTSAPSCQGHASLPTGSTPGRRVSLNSGRETSAGQRLSGRRLHMV